MIYNIKFKDGMKIRPKFSDPKKTHLVPLTRALGVWNEEISSRNKLLQWDGHHKIKHSGNTIYMMLHLKQYFSNKKIILPEFYDFYCQQ